MEPFILPLLLFVVMYMLLIRPQQKRLKEQQALIASATEGDRVLMTSGIYGTLTEVLETSAYVELADGFEILIDRQAIQQLVDEFPTDEAELADGDIDDVDDIDEEVYEDEEAEA